MKSGLASLIFLSFTVTLLAQNALELTMGNSWCYEEATSITAVNNNHYLVAGNYMCGGGNYERKTQLLYLNSNLDTLWTKRDLGLNGLVRKTSDDQFIWVGGNNASFSYDTVVLTKATLNGTRLWESHFTFGPCYSNVWDVIETSDGGFVITGIYAEGNCNLPGIKSFVLKTDAWGNELWRTDIAGTALDQLYQVKETNDGGLGLLGWTTSLGAGGRDFYLLKLDNLGNLLWERTFGDTLQNFA